MSQEFSLDTVVSGSLDVTIEGVGTFGADYQNMSLAGFAGNVYVVLTGKRIDQVNGFFELVSFDLENAKLVVRLAA